MSKDLDIKSIGKEAKKLIETNVKAIVDHVDDVEVELVTASYRIMLELHTNSNDVMHVVGKHGNIIESIRSLLYVFGGKNKVKVSLDYITERRNKSDSNYSK